MNEVKISEKAGRQVVVFDQLDVTYPGGVYIDPTTAKARFTDGVIPAGTLVMPDTNGTFKVVNETLSQTNTAGAVGLTAHDVVIDDIPLVAVVMAGTARKEMLPDKEKAGVAFLRTALPRISFI
nr:MAG TPA: Head decoration protein/Viral Protein, capsid protein, Structural [Caudoviricetes sp.]DAW60084.1 MAG TPA: Head decoration protein/Viral Protein, capsid protein, Structural [Caudoviricetes sp.]